jgi:hypothetical protein
MIKETFTFLLENSCSESSTLVLETLNLQNSWITLLLTSHKHRTQAYKQANKQEQLRTDIPNKKESFKGAYKRIGLVATVKRTKKNMENGARVEKKQLSEDLCYKETKETISFIYFNLEN